MDWTIGPFEKVSHANPCLAPQPGSSFFCPMQQRQIRWEEKDVFNPAAVVRDGRVWLLYRAEDAVGAHAGTSRIGLAVSGDGLHFETLPAPVLYPGHDGMQAEEWDGGCEDPRVVEREDGTYVMLYTAYNGQLARLCSASSTDLRSWQKHGPVFRQALARTTRPFLTPSEDFELTGQVMPTCFIEGLVWFRERYFLYYGTADSRVAVACCPAYL